MVPNLYTQDRKCLPPEGTKRASWSALDGALTRNLSALQSPRRSRSSNQIRQTSLGSTRIAQPETLGCSTPTSPRGIRRTPLSNLWEPATDLLMGPTFQESKKFTDHNQRASHDGRLQEAQPQQQSQSEPTSEQDINRCTHKPWWGGMGATLELALLANMRNAKLSAVEGHCMQAVHIVAYQLFTLEESFMGYC
jgi:hypothetical protein